MVSQSSELGQLREMLQRLDAAPTLRNVADVERAALPLIEAALPQSPAETKDWLLQLRAALVASAEHAAARIQMFEEVAAQCRELADMDFGLLYNSARDLFAIGYNVSERRLDASFYDLLASEARLASFIVIAQGNSARSIGSRWAAC